LEESAGWDKRERCCCRAWSMARAAERCAEEERPPRNLRVRAAAGAIELLELLALDVADAGEKSDAVWDQAGWERAARRIATKHAANRCQAWNVLIR
jgi:hypothetical protein